jgi:biopolymer transport protein ExbD
MARPLRTRLKIEQGLMIAPLLDIMFLVLLFFIFNVNFSSVESFDIDIPIAHHADNAQPLDRIVIIIFPDRNDYLINGIPFTVEEFIPALKEAMAEQESQQILLLGSQQASYGRVMELMDRIKVAGARGISLGVDNS